ncbi:galactokinase-like isoform X2 [Plodia interpunctella]|nr:galactokinase-like isoform X2 [Plodia interpunctella]XP_053607723.1 galactokinase-like isoform X2 [Plodia interpunctella]
MSHDAVPVGEATLLQQACDKYQSSFGRAAVAASSAPGRVNLIGEHVDYCEGYVLPVAIPFVTVVVGGYNDTDECHVISVLANGDVVSTAFPATSVAKLTPGEPAWANYVKGTVSKFPKPVQGFNMAITSDVPMGAGLSSSASLEVAVCTFLEVLTGLTVDPVEKARLCQSAEHEFPGVPCGVMDQYIVSMAKKDTALLIDCRSFGSTHVPMKTGDYVVLVTNSNVKHKLTGSEYPQRRAQCEEAASRLGLPSLRSAKTADLERLKQMNCDELVLRRAQHVIEEIERTQQVAKSFRENDLERVGRLFYESHESMSKLMEISCPELDELVRIIRPAPGVLGARMTGGGFGGCVVTLVKKDQVDNLKKLILSKYRGDPVFFVCQPSDGAKGIKL